MPLRVVTFVVFSLLLSSVWRSPRIVCYKRQTVQPLPLSPLTYAGGMRYG